MTANNILVLVDGSLASKGVLSAALKGKSSDAKLTICHSCQKHDTAIHGDHESFHKFFSQVEEHAAKFCNDLKEECEKLGVTNVSTLVLSSAHPKDEVCQYAEKNGVDLIVVGNRGLTEMQQILIGSFSNYIASHAHCDVKIARATETSDVVVHHAK